MKQKAGPRLYRELGCIIELLYCKVSCTWTTVISGVLSPHSKLKVTAIHLNLMEKAIVSDFSYELGDEKNHFIGQSWAT